MITVLGAGSWGTAIACVFARNGYPVKLWGHDALQMQAMIKTRENTRYLPGYCFPTLLEPVVDFSEAVSHVQDIFIVVPSTAFLEILTQLKTYGTHYRIAWGTKGLDPDTHALFSTTVETVFSQNTPLAILSGPSFAKEVMQEKPTAVSLSGNDPIFLQDLVNQLHSKTFRVYLNQDFLGVQLCGALKNVLAIAVGIADGLALGANTRSALITRGLAEMGRLCVALGGQLSTLMSLAGVGDLVLTCTDNQSRNRRFGLALGQGFTVEEAKQQIGQAVEGLDNAKEVYQLAADYQLEMPITEQVYQILYANAKPSAALEALLLRESKLES